MYLRRNNYGNYLWYTSNIIEKPDTSEQWLLKADTQNTYIPVSVGDPTAESHAVTKEYRDGKTNALQASAILKSGGKMTGKLKITATPTEADDVVDKEYVDAIIPAYTAADNGKVLGVVEGKLAWVTKA